jgi:hypothetical protein
MRRRLTAYDPTRDPSALDSQTLSGGAARLKTRTLQVDERCEMPLTERPWSGHDRFGRALRLFETEWITLASLGFVASVVLTAIPQELVQDSWLALVAGREIVADGLPATDSLNVWTRGSDWVDQQWLAQTTMYGLFSFGGFRLVALAHVAALSATLLLGVAAARRLGGTAMSASLLAISSLVVAPWALQIRAQTAAMPLFVLVVWLLASDSRAPSRRVYLTLPLIVLWANLHGAVVLGAGLVVIRGLTIARERSRPFAAAALTGGPFVCLLVSPYGLSLIGYYENLLLNPSFREYVAEWQASVPSVMTAAFYVYAAASVWLLTRHGRLLTFFERAALVLTLVAGFLAVRNILWFSLAGLILLPRLIDRALPPLRPLPGAGRLKIGVAALTATSVALTLVAVTTRSDGWFTREWPAGAAKVVSAAARDGNVKVMSDERYADWLLWKHPELRGRVAFGIRFELFTARQIEELAEYKRATDVGWHRIAAGYDVLVLDRRARSVDAETELAKRGYRVAYRDKQVAVLVTRGATG